MEDTFAKQGSLNVINALLCIYVSIKIKIYAKLEIKQIINVVIKLIKYLKLYNHNN